MTREERQKAIDALKISAPVMAVTQEEFKDYIQTLNKIMDWLEQEPCDDAINREDALMALTGEYTESPIELLSKAIKRINALPPVTPSYNSIKTELEPCTDAISREAAVDACLNGWNKDYKEIVAEIRALPPVTPQYTEAEVQKMQDLEFAEIQKAYEIGKEEGSSEKPNRWIPVSERLPKPYTWVYATCKSLIDDRENWVIDSCYVPNEEIAQEDMISDWGNVPMLNMGDAEVIAWMKWIRPEPYNPVGGEQE